MRFNLNEFLLAVSFTLDFVEMDILGLTSNHGKRTAYISLCIAKELEFDAKDQHDIVALSILHDNGITEKMLHDRIWAGEVSSTSVERVREHCLIGEANVEFYPFQTKIHNVIKYHHESYDGTGLFNIRGEDIPLMAQIIKLADIMEINFNLEDRLSFCKQELNRFVIDQSDKLFSSKIANAFLRVSAEEEFWTHLSDERIGQALQDATPQFTVELTYEELHEVTSTFSKIIDSKSSFTKRHSSQLSEKTAMMADYYQKGYEEKQRLIIAADLHDIGKLAVPNSILDSPRTLTDSELKIIKKHTYYTRLALQEISGFEDITEWAANHHEKLNGGGYPFGKTAEQLDFNSRMMACLDIYQALTEERPYRVALQHEKAMGIMKKMTDSKLIDGEIVSDIDKAFSELKALS